MSLFMAMAAVAASADDVRQALEALEVDDAMPLARAPERTLVFFSDYETRGGVICEELSKKLQVPVFHIHVHDGDLWMYEFFVAGEQVDEFNPWPDYWEDISEEEFAAWSGDAELVARHWPGIGVEQIEGYLVQNRDVEEEGAKAYPDDEAEMGGAWQFADFIAALGIPYPSDEEMEEE